MNISFYFLATPQREGVYKSGFSPPKPGFFPQNVKQKMIIFAPIYSIFISEAWKLFTELSGKILGFRGIKRFSCRRVESFTIFRRRAVYDNRTNFRRTSPESNRWDGNWKTQGFSLVLGCPQVYKAILYHIKIFLRAPF